MKKNIEYIQKKHPLTIGQANRVAKEFGNFDRNSIYLFDYVTSCLPYNQKLSYRTNVITVTAKELYNLLFGYVSRKILTDKQFNSLNSAVTKMLSTPLQLKNSEHYLFTKTVNQTVDNEGFQQLIFTFAKDQTAKDYFYNLRHDYFTYSVEEMVSFKSAMTLKLYKYSLSLLKGNYKAEKVLSKEDLDNIFRDNNKKFSDMTHAQIAIQAGIKNLSENKITNKVVSIISKEINDPASHGNLIKLVVTSLVKQNYKEDSDDEHVSLLNIEDQDSDFHKFAGTTMEKEASTDDISLF